MSKHLNQSKFTRKVVGVLDKNENDELVINVIDKENYEEVNVLELIDECLGKEIQFICETE